MEEKKPANGEPSDRSPALKLDFIHQRPKPEGRGPSKRLVWGGLVLALALMFAGTVITVVSRQKWGMYLFLAAALLYLVCRCMTIGLLDTTPKVMAIVLMLAGCFMLGNWPALSVMGILGIACLVAALAFILAFGMGYMGREAKNRKEAER
ncbi:MAG: hypothetical protein FJ291_13310 [Planctomycetes bacterium]|nr:hypothetical protein [Planctomycetota bacterium]